MDKKSNRLEVIRRAAERANFKKASQDKSKKLLRNARAGKKLIYLQSISV